MTEAISANLTRAALLCRLKLGAVWYTVSFAGPGRTAGRGISQWEQPAGSEVRHSLSRTSAGRAQCGPRCLTRPSPSIRRSVYGRCVCVTREVSSCGTAPSTGRPPVSSPPPGVGGSSRLCRGSPPGPTSRC